MASSERLDRSKLAELMKEVIVDKEDLVCLNKEKLQEVIRCKDCKYYIADGCDECALMSAKSIIAGINNKRWYSDFYCAWGERRQSKDETD